MKKLSVFIFILFLFSMFTLSANISCDRSLKPTLNKILQLSEAKNLVAEIQKDGPFSICLNNNALAKQFGAYWDLDQRKICISLSAHSSEGQIISAILFEMHNARANNELKKYYDAAMAGTISRENFVRAIEYIEYKNSHSTAKISSSGIRAGIFPHDAYLETYPNFEMHYRIQKIGGHSQWIARHYDSLRQA